MAGRWTQKLIDRDRFTVPANNGIFPFELEIYLVKRE